MATEQIQAHVDWRTIQKERERERRRLRDRQRRQSMSLEEREKHLARRRKNYQLRRQKAANAQSDFSNDNLALVSVQEPTLQSDCIMQVEVVQAYETQNVSAMKYHGKTTVPGSYKYPRAPRLTQIRHLARLLNSSADKGIGATPQGVRGRGLRLIHVKHLARALNSNVEKTSEQKYI